MKILIVEDELPAANHLKRLLSNLLPDAQLEGPLQSVAAAAEYLREHTPDLVMLDIHLSDGSAFDLLQQIDLVAPIVFCTAYDQYAIDAFKHNSVDYLLKPLDPKQLEQAINKWKGLAPQPEDLSFLKDLLKPTASYKKRFVFRIGDTLKLIPVSDVVHCYSTEKVTFLCTSAGKEYPVDESLNQLEEMLDPSVFFRASRQCILHIENIAAVHTYSQSKLMVDLQHNHERIAVSRSRQADFKAWLKN